MIHRRYFSAIIVTVMTSSVMPSRAAEIVLSGGHAPSTGHVVQVDVDRGRLTIEHRPIQQFYMASMTMTFRVKDPALLTFLTPGDKIRFDVERDHDGFIITRIENAN